MKNRKGFTIIELLAVIVILGLIMGIAIPAVNKTLADFRTKYYTKLEKSMESAGKSYLSDKKNAKPTDLLNSKIIEGDSLVENKYLSDILDYNKHNCTDSYVVAVKFGDKDYKYQACLKCPEDEYQTDTSNDEYDLCNSAWKSNDYITSGGAESSSEIFYVYYGTSKKEIEREVGISYGVTKSDVDGKVLATVTEGGDSTKTVYPDNINELVNANLDQVITLRYTMPDGRNVTRKAMLYRYKAPVVTLTYTNGNKATGKAAGAVYNQGSSEWANSITVKLELQSTDKTKYSELLSSVTMKKVQYFDKSKKAWIDGSCTAGSGTCTWINNSNFDNKVQLRIVDSKGNASDATNEYSMKVDATKPTASVAVTSGTKVGSVYVTDVTIGLTKNDTGGSGLVKHGMGESTTADYNSKESITITSDLNKTYYGYVMDNAGNEGISSGLAINRDKIYKVALSNEGANVTAGSTTTNATYGNTTLSAITVPAKRVTVKFSKASGITATTTDKTGNYTFKGWYTAKSGGTKIASNAATPALEASTSYTDASKKWNKVVADNEVTLHAQWTAPSITLPTVTKPGNVCKWVNGSSQWTSGGTYKPSDVDGATSITMTASCEVCPAGTYADNNTCKKCPAGTYSSAGSTTCTKCACGSYSGEGAASCTKCSAGYYATGTGNTACTKATAGHYAAAGSCSQSTCATGTYSGAGAASCTQCPAGYRDGAGTTAQSNCIKSVACGKRVATANGDVSNCAAGTYSLAHNVKYGSTSSCTTDSNGYYSAAGACSQTQCPAGYRDGSGTTAQSNCIKTVACGNYVATAKGGTSQCAAGTYKAEHNVKYGSTSSCSGASKGYYAAAGACSQTQCPAGYRDGSGTTSQGNCKMNVAAGKFVKKAKDSSATSCPSGTESSSHTVKYGNTSSCTASCQVTFSKKESSTRGYYDSCWNTCKGSDCNDSHLHWEHNCATPSTGGSRANVCHNGYCWNFGGQGSRMCYYNPDSSPYYSDLWERCDTSEAYYDNSRQTTGGTFCFNSAKIWDYYRSTEYGVATVCYGTQCGQSIICTGNNCT